MFFHPKRHVSADKEANEKSIFRATAASVCYFRGKGRRTEKWNPQAFNAKK